ncbi:NADH-quinone oxidoreductase subunit F, partial [Candidatus Nomurabacteria bacterium]|nr:NADH-quinone oxidoreductase subunit F [Candidatus Nomurabacteria bacterium]
MTGSILTKQIIDLDKTREIYKDASASYKSRIVICAGTGCMANGAMSIYNKFREVIYERGLKVAVMLDKEEHKEDDRCDNDFLLVESGCQGFCQMGPLVTLYPQKILYTKVKTSDVEEIVDRTLIKNEYVDRLLYECPDSKHHVRDMDKIPFYERQNRIMLKLCGHINVHDADEYIANGGYFMARKSVLEMTDTQICKEILDSGLRGRGGGGFPT